MATFIDLNDSSAVLIELIDTATIFIVFEPSIKSTDRLELLGNIVFRNEAEESIARRVTKNPHIRQLVMSSKSIQRRKPIILNTVTRLVLEVER